MSEKELVLLVVAMRKAQRTYFRTRRSYDLEAAKDLEKRVDQALQEKLNELNPEQPTLF